MNFLHYAILLFVFSTVVLFMFSKLGTPKSETLLEKVTFAPKELRFRFKWTSETVLTLILIALVLVIWWIFSPLGIAS